MSRPVRAALAALSILLAGCRAASMPTPTPQPAATPTPLPTLPPGIDPTDLATPPEIITFNVEAPDRIAPGDAITARWQAQGYDALLCLSYGGQLIQGPPCQAVPVSGEHTLTIDADPAPGYPRPGFADVQLIVYGAGISAEQHILIPFVCQSAWPFEPAPEWCPLFLLENVPATLQPYTGGRMLRAEQGIVPYPWSVALLDDGSFETGQLYEPGTLDDLPGPPPALGSVQGEALPYAMAYGCEDGPAELDPCYLLLPDGAVLRLTYAGDGHAWEPYP